MHGYILWIPSRMPHCLQEKLAKVARMQAAVEEAEKSSTATSSPPSAVAVPGWICHHAHACPWHACMRIHAKACTCMCTHLFFGSITEKIYMHMSAYVRLSKLMHAGQFFSASATGAHAPGAVTRRLPSDGSMTWSTWVSA